MARAVATVALHGMRVAHLQVPHTELLQQLHTVGLELVHVEDEVGSEFRETEAAVVPVRRPVVGHPDIGIVKVIPLLSRIAEN